MLRYVRDVLWYLLGSIVGILSSRYLIGILPIKLWFLIFGMVVVLLLTVMVAMKTQTLNRTEY